MNTTLKMKNNPKNEDNLKIKDNQKVQGNLEYKEDLKMKLNLKKRCPLKREKNYDLKPEKCMCYLFFTIPTQLPRNASHEL